MTYYLLRRLVQVVPVALLVATLVFSLIHLIPGDPVQMMLGDGAQAADVQALRESLGLDRPLGEQYLEFMTGLFRGDLGESLHYRRPVTELLAEHYPATLELALASMLVALMISLPLGVLAALHKDGVIDQLSRFFSLLGVSIPNFWLGPMLILVFAIYWNLLPVSGREGWASLVLPAITLGTALAGLLTRMVRSSVAEELHRPYLVTAQAKGLRRGQAVVRHALRNALIPVVTIIGLQFGALLTGAIITETIFSWPGLGRLLIQAIRLRDYPLVQGGVLIIAVTYVLVNLLTDLIYALLDPRIRYQEEGA
ncbi:MAG: nickel ABC transporter permease [Acidobacteriota bacterium]|nr:nickel ABC transporter permease [Acidobacteriota bacterium]